MSDEAIAATPDPVESTAKPRKRRRGLWWKIPLALLALLLIVWGGWRYHMHRELNEARQRVRDAGYPVTLAELDAYYPMPQGTNAAEIYEQAFALLVNSETLDDKLPAFSREIDWPVAGEALDKETMVAIEEHLDLNKDALTALSNASTVDTARYDADLSQGYQAELFHLSQLRRCANLYSLKIVFHDQRNESREALESLNELMALGESLRQEPVVISQLVRNSVHVLVISRLEVLLANHEYDDEVLNELESSISRMHQPDAWRRAFAGERASGMSLFDDAANGSNTFYVLLHAVGLLDMEQADYAECMGTMIEQAGDPEAVPFDIEAHVNNGPSYYLLTRIIVPALGLAADYQRADHALRTVAVTGLMAKRYEIKHGHWPDALDDLVPDFMGNMPLDPFNGKSLQYRKTANGGVVIYSIGIDRADNGGVRGEKLSEPGTDIVFQLHR